MTDLMDSIKLVMEEALDICSYNKKLLSSPLVSSTNNKQLEYRA